MKRDFKKTNVDNYVRVKIK